MVAAKTSAGSFAVGILERIRDAAGPSWSEREGRIVSGNLHVLGLPHTSTTNDYATCAYTMRVVRFCRMMTGRDRNVILYGSELNEAPCDEHVVVVSEERRQHWFGGHDENDLGRGGFDWNPQSPWWSATNARIIGEIAQRAEPTDILCLTAGLSQKLVADAFPNMIGAEIMVGYEGILTDPRPSPVAAAFESHTHRHFVCGLNGWRFPREYDAVIPNQFDPAELPYGGGGDYLLFIGRLVGGKAPQVAGRVADALGMKLVVAGPGATAWGEGFVEAPEVRIEAQDLEYVGPVGVEERASLMGGAAVTIVPTIYQEPFGGVAVESMTCGTPVVAKDFGAFVETVKEGVSGYTFSTLQEAVDATEQAMRLDRRLVRQYALDHYSLDAVAPMYERWFANLDSLWGEGWTGLRQPLNHVGLSL